MECVQIGGVAFEGAEKLWQDRAAEAAVNSPEPWLADDEAAQHVRWLDSD